MKEAHLKRIKKMARGICPIIMAMAIAAQIAAQVNIQSDVITFRESANQDKVTTHHGRFEGQAMLSSGQYALSGTNTGTYGDGIGVYGYSNPAPYYGIGGRFSGAWKGVDALSTMPGSGSRYAGYFLAMNGSYNYAVYATTYGHRYTENYWAGWFDGDVRVTQLLNPSDERLKKDIQPYTGGLETVLQLKPRSYSYRLDEYPTMSLPEGEHVGLVAQEVEAVLPNLIADAAVPQDKLNDAENPSHSVKSQDPPATMKHINTLELVPLLVSAVQEQQATIKKLQERIVKLEGHGY
jgi:hypothetical protein